MPYIVRITHFEKREDAFSKMIEKRGGIGIACDNNAALEIVGNRYRVITSAPNAKVYKLFKQNGHALWFRSYLKIVNTRL